MHIKFFCFNFYMKICFDRVVPISKGHIYDIFCKFAIYSVLAPVKNEFGKNIN